MIKALDSPSETCRLGPRAAHGSQPPGAAGTGTEQGRAWGAPAPCQDWAQSSVRLSVVQGESHLREVFPQP